MAVIVQKLHRSAHETPAALLYSSYNLQFILSVSLQAQAAIFDLSTRPSNIHIRQHTFLASEDNFIMRYSVVLVSTFAVASIAAPVNTRNSFFSEAEGVLDDAEHTRLGSLLENTKANIEANLHTRGLFGTLFNDTKGTLEGLASSKVGSIIFDGLGAAEEAAKRDIYERGLFGDLVNSTKGVIEGAAESGIGGELLDGAKALAPDFTDLARRGEYSSRFLRRGSSLSTSLPESHSGIEDNVTVQIHSLLSSLKEHLKSRTVTERDIFGRGLFGSIFNSTESAVKNAVESGITGKFLDGAKTLGPDLLDLAARHEHSSPTSRHGTISPSSSPVSLSGIEDSAMEKLHSFLHALEGHSTSNPPRLSTSEARSVADGFQAANKALEPFGTSLTGIIGSAATAAASKAGSDAVTGAESLFHHFFNRTAILGSIVAQGEQPTSHLNNLFPELRRSL